MCSCLSYLNCNKLCSSLNQTSLRAFKNQTIQQDHEQMNIPFICILVVLTAKQAKKSECFAMHQELCPYRDSFI